MDRFETMTATTRPHEMAPKMSKKEKAEAARIAAEEAAAAAAKKAEEEEKQRQETEARLAKEESERQVQEKAMQAELDERIAAEDEANASFYDERSSTLSKLQAQALARDEWEVFIACNPLPDVMSECAVNGFLTEWMEKPRDGADHADHRHPPALPPWVDWGEVVRLAERVGAGKDMLRVDVVVGVPADAGRRDLEALRTASDQVRRDAVKIVVADCELAPPAWELGQQNGRRA